LDEQKNKATQKTEEIISKPSSKVRVMVIPTNEELVIAMDTAKIVQSLDNVED
jgi:acetate kinase